MSTQPSSTSTIAPRIKVIHYMWSANFGGIEKMVIDLTKMQLLANKVEPFILIGCKKGKFIDKLREMGIPHGYIGMKNGSDLLAVINSKTKNLFSDADIIHIHTFNPLIYFAAIRSGKKIVYTVHGNFFFGRKMNLSDHVNKALANLIIPRFTDYITYNSLFSKNISAKLFNTGNLPGEIIANGIFLEKINESTFSEIQTDLLSSLTGKFVVGTSSRFVGVKRIDRIIEGFAAFSKNKNDVVLLLVGDGLMRQQVEEWIDKAGIRSKTILTGFKPNVKSYQEAMDVCVFASQNEAFGLVAVETLALGKPTIVFKDAGGMLEIIENEFPQDVVKDVEELAQRFENYYHTKVQPDEKAKEKRQLLASKYDISNTEALFYAKYKELIEDYP